MSKNRSPRKAYKPRAVHVNAFEIAINSVRKLSEMDVARQRVIVTHNLIVLKHADGTAPADLQAAVKHDDKCLGSWKSLADATNVAENLAEVGIGAGRQAVEIIEGANKALGSIFERRQQTGAWSIEVGEIEAFEWLIALHCDTQLPLCSYGEFERAYQRTVRKVREAMRGNVAPGTTVIKGDIGAIAEGVLA